MTAEPSLDTRIEPATLDDLPALVDLVMALMEMEEDFEPDRDKQEHGLKLILEQPNRGRIFVLRTDHALIGMVNLLFTISTAEGGFVILLEDLVIHPEHRGPELRDAAGGLRDRLRPQEGLQANHPADRQDQRGVAALLPALRIHPVTYDSDAPDIEIGTPTHHGHLSRSDRRK